MGTCLLGLLRLDKRVRTDHLEQHLDNVCALSIRMANKLTHVLPETSGSLDSQPRPYWASPVCQAYWEPDRYPTEPGPGSTSYETRGVTLTPLPPLIPTSCPLPQWVGLVDPGVPWVGTPWGSELGYGNLPHLPGLVLGWD